MGLSLALELERDVVRQGEPIAGRLFVRADAEVTLLSLEVWLVHAGDDREPLSRRPPHVLGKRVVLTAGEHAHAFSLRGVNGPPSLQTESRPWSVHARAVLEDGPIEARREFQLAPPDVTLRPEPERTRLLHTLLGAAIVVAGFALALHLAWPGAWALATMGHALALGQTPELSAARHAIEPRFLIGAFGSVGLALFVGHWLAPRLALGRVQVQLAPELLRPGETVSVAVVLSPRRGVWVESVNVVLAGVERSSGAGRERLLFTERRRCPVDRELASRDEHAVTADLPLPMGVPVPALEPGPKDVSWFIAIDVRLDRGPAWHHVVQLRRIAGTWRKAGTRAADP